MKLSIVITCTAKKHFPNLPGLAYPADFADIHSDHLAVEWLQRVGATKRSSWVPPFKLYAGPVWNAGSKLPDIARNRDIGAELWIASTGCGLVRPTTPIPSYNIRYRNGAVTDTNWWRDVACRAPVDCDVRSIKNLAKRGPVLLVLGADYLALLREDVLAAVVEHKERVTVISVIADRADRVALAGSLISVRNTRARILANVLLARDLLQLTNGPLLEDFQQAADILKKRL